MTKQKLINYPIIGLKSLATKFLGTLATLAVIYALSYVFYILANFPSIAFDVVEGKTDYLTIWGNVSNKLADIVHYIFGLVFMLWLLNEVLTLIGTTPPYIEFRNHAKNNYDAIIGSSIWQWFSKSKFFCITTGAQAAAFIMVFIYILMMIAGFCYVVKGELTVPELVSRVFTFKFFFAVSVIAGIAFVFGTAFAYKDIETLTQQAEVESVKLKVLSVELEVGTADRKEGNFALVFKTEKGSYKTEHRGNAQKAVITYLEEYAKLHKKTLPEWIYNATDLHPKHIENMKEVAIQ